MMPALLELTSFVGGPAASVVDLRGPAPSQPGLTTSLGSPTVVNMRPTPTPTAVEVAQGCQTVQLTGKPTPFPVSSVPPTPGSTVVDMRPREKPVTGGTVVLAPRSSTPTIDPAPPQVTRPRPRARARRRSRRATAGTVAKSGGGDPPGPGPGDAPRRRQQDLGWRASP